MKFRLELPIRKSPAEVWKAFDSTENLKKWQPTLKTFEHVSGAPGQPGAVSKLTYEENGREFMLTERITHRDEPRRFDGVYTNDFAENMLRNTFEERGSDETLWTLETEFKFKTFLMRILGPLMKRSFVTRTERDMQRFRELAESLWEGMRNDNQNNE